MGEPVRVTRVLAAPVRAFVWTLDVCDDKGDPSLTKMLALGIGVVALRDAWLHKFTALNVAALALAAAVAFGRSLFMRWLDRWSFASTSSTNVSASVALTGDTAAIMKEAGNLWRDDERGEHTERDYK